LQPQPPDPASALSSVFSLLLSALAFIAVLSAFPVGRSTALGLLRFITDRWRRPTRHAPELKLLTALPAVEEPDEMDVLIDGILTKDPELKRFATARLVA